VKIGIAVVAMSVGLGASAASAQPGWYGYGYGYRYGSPHDAGEYYGSLSPRHLISVVRAAGLRPISHPMRTGRNYIVDAVDRHGDLKRVVIDGYYGQVVRIAAVTRPDYPPSRTVPWSGPDTGPRPPARIPREPEVSGPNSPDIYEEEAPMRPRARIPAARDAIEEPSLSPGAEIPPPPAPRNAVRPAKPSATPNTKPRGGEGESAAVNPAPLPRSRPAPGSGEAAASPEGKPAAAAAAPRVVLRGGPARRTDDAAAPASRGLDGDKAPATTQTPAATLPPMQSLD